jgi:hypothetical protein
MLRAQGSSCPFGKAFDTEETESLATKAKCSRSPHMYPAFMLARNLFVNGQLELPCLLEMSADHLARISQHLQKKPNLFIDRLWRSFSRSLSSW